MPSVPTLWPGAPLLSGILSRPGDEVPAPRSSHRAVWVLVVANVAHDRPAWWAEYQIRVGSVSEAGELGRWSAQEWRRGEARLRSASEARARYHRERLAEPVTAVRLERLAGDVPGGLQVLVYPEPVAGWLALAVWLAGWVVSLGADVRCRLRGALGAAAAPPLITCALVWLKVTPVDALRTAYHMVIAGALLGSLLGVGLARTAAFAQAWLLDGWRSK
jgi:hypothetical protein